MNKLIIILSIFSVAICTELSDFQTTPEYGPPIENYQNKELTVQYTQQPEINFNNNLNQNYELSSNFNQFSMQQLPLNEQNLPTNYFDLPNPENFQIQYQNLDINNAQNYFENPATELKSLVIEKSKEIPLDFLSNLPENIGNLDKPEIGSKSESNPVEIQTLIKELLWKNYIESIQKTNMNMKRNEENVPETLHSVSDQQNMKFNLPQILEQHLNLIQQNKPKPVISNQASINPHINIQIPPIQTQNMDYNLNSFGYNNQQFHQMNPSRIHFNQFMVKPTTHQIPNSNYKIPLNTEAIPLVPQNQYSTDFNNRIYPQVSTYTNRIPKYFNPQNHKSKITTKIYTYAADDDNEEEQINDELINEISSRKHYKVIFIKAPHQLNRNTLKLVQAQLQNDEKTVIYVLSKKTDPSEVQQTLESIRTKENKPEVHFIKYKTEDEAILTQHNIKAQYDNIEGNAVSLNEGSIIKPPGNYPNFIQRGIDENQNYLPPV